MVLFNTKMNNDDAAFAAVSAILKSLAVDPSTPPVLHPRPTDQVKLPGRDSPEKQALERELSLLTLRVSQLETRANSVAFPDTPNEISESFYGEEVGPSPKRPTRYVVPTPHNGIDRALEGLREHVDDQSKLLDSQRRELAGVNAQLLEQKQLQEHAARAEEIRVEQLERELWKHQQANEAFQKALREIGEIVTAVARGDLSKKVRMNSVDMDPEITTFKRTINTMMDQLQVFASEVSRVAREVGTEGILGGQAQIEGVDGTWKELTDNGKPCCDATGERDMLIRPQSISWPRISPTKVCPFRRSLSVSMSLTRSSSPRNCIRYHCRRPRRLDPKD